VNPPSLPLASMREETICSILLFGK
jgi:hypothetical protein